MGGAVVEDLVVDLVGEDDQLVLPGDLDDALQHVIRIQRPGGVVGVDDDDGLRALGDLRAHVVQIGQPAGALVAHVVHGRAPREAHGRRPQRIVGGGHQHLVAGIEQRVERQHDQLAHAVADVDVVDRHTANALELRIVHDGLAGREQAPGVGVAGGIGQVGHDVLAHFVGCIEAERRHVADVELDDALPFFFHLLRPGKDGATDVITDVGQFCRLVDGFHDETGDTTGTGRQRRRCADTGARLAAGALQAIEAPPVLPPRCVTMEAIA